MPTEFEYRLPASESEVNALAAIQAECFGAPMEAIQERVQRFGRENLRVLTEGSHVAAGLWVVPMGQFFGERSVPMHGVAAVGVGPADRGRGAAHALMCETVRELHDAGIALSTLYPATQILYRKSGYEQAGTRFRVKVPVASIAVRERSREIRPLSEQDRSEVMELYGVMARTRDGYLDRRSYIWDRVFKIMNQPAKGYGVYGPRGLEGYTYLIQEKRQPFGYNLMLGDLCVTTPQAARHMLSFLGDHRSMTEYAIWNSGPHDPIFQLLPEHAPEMLTLGNYWMLRITHVERALEARGYPRQLETEVHFRITDDIVPGNDGDFLLRVTGGRGEVRRGGKGSVRIDVRGLATLYSGLRSPEGIRLAGQIDGSESDLAVAGALFAGPAPSMSDMF